MSKGIIKAAVLLIVFVISVMAFGNMMNYANEDLTSEMAEAKLPVITLYENGTEINELHGYAVEMNAAYMRDSITPIGEERILPITIRTYHTAVNEISYEIRSLDASRLIADAKVMSYGERKGQISAELTIQNLLESDTEYLLLIKLAADNDQTLYYYTRIIEMGNSHVAECVEFAQDYHAKTLNPETVGTLAMYMEKMTDDNTTLHFTSLHSSLRQIGWADFTGEKLTEPIPSIKEITDTYNVVLLEYVFTSVNENGESEYYNVEEYYRIRYTETRSYLLNFERTVEQIFRGENTNIYENKIELGIRSGDIEYKANETGSCVAFVQEGELWCFNQEENTLAKIFSFRGYEGIDNRENYGEHEIKIVRIDEAGSVDFIVYGYMNRGIHEGQVGITVYRYDSASNTNEEEVFIPCLKSFEIMKSELGQLMYVNEAGELFLMVGGSIYGVELDTLKVRELVNNLADGDFAISESNCFVAWEQEEENGGGIQVMNLSTGKSSRIEAETGEAVKPLGFIEEDFVYGIAKRIHFVSDAAGNQIFPMYQIRIMDVSGSRPELLKTYEKKDYFVSGIRMEGSTMYLQRMTFNGVAYVDAEQDMIMNREGDTRLLVYPEEGNAGVKEITHSLILPDNSTARAPKLLTPKETILDEERIVALEKEGMMRRYYVYVKGDVICTTDSVIEAITEANENMGVVIADDLAYVWKRSKKTAQGQIFKVAAAEEDASLGSVALCLNAMLQNEGININVGALIDGGETPKSILNNTMRDATVYDLTGCGVEEALYYVSCKSPVFAMTGTNEAVLLLGYDANSVIVYEPGGKGVHKKTLDAAEEEFQNAGNIFFTYQIK